MKKLLKFAVAVIILAIPIVLHMPLVSAASAIMDIDSPSSNTVMGHQMTVYGWTINNSNIKSIDVYIDGSKHLGSASIGGSRSDIAAAYPSYPVGDIHTYSFNASFNLSAYSYGSHTLKVVSVGNDGTTATGTVNIVNVAPVLDVDYPAASYNTNSSSTIPVRGWAIAPDGVQSVSISIDGSSDPSLSTTITGSSLNLRNDVKNAYAGYPNISAYSGYGVDYSIGLLSTGTHSAKITMVTNDGNVVTSTRSFKIVRPDSIVDIDSPGPNSYMSNTMSVYGWAIDPTNVKSINFLIDGKNVGSAVPGGTRGDVNKVYPSYAPSNISSYSTLLNLNLSNYSYGNHTLTVSSTGNDGTVASGYVNIVNKAPILDVDYPAANYNSSSNSVVSFRGWAIAPDGVKSVSMNIDGSSDPSLSATINGSSLSLRNDVKNAYAGYPNISAYSGYVADFSINSISAGNHTANITMVTNDGNVVNSSRSFTVTKPKSYIDVDAPSSGTYMSSSMSVYGWAISPANVKAINIAIDGKNVTTLAPGGYRSDVNKVYPSYAPSNISGYSTYLNLNLANYSYGNHTMTVTSVGYDETQTSASMNVINPVPQMCVDSPAESSPYATYSNGGTISVRGWALNASSVSSVSVSVDGVAIANSVSINQASSDVHNVYPAYPGSANARFNTSFSASTLTDGIHIVNVTATGSDGLSTSASIAITVGSTDFTTKYNISLSSMLSLQQSGVTTNELDPNYISGEFNGFEFLQLKYDGTHSTLTAAQLQTMLPYNNGNDILYNHAQAFIDAANAYHINPFYLVAHARIETGNGTSTLADGQVHNGVTYYNMFGIGAYDGSANSSGLIAAYSSTWVTPGGVTKTGWASVDDAIEGGAYWISKNYVNSVAMHQGDGLSHYDQDTLYQMKWDPYASSLGKSPYEYATGPTWADSIASIMYQYSNLMSSSGMTFSFDIPSYHN